nr:ATP synthase F0 subunit 8 [Xestocephalus sp. n. A ZLL-2024a]
MPQMSPMWWMTMMMIITIMMMMMNSMTYFYMPKIKTKKQLTKKEMMTWKW